MAKIVTVKVVADTKDAIQDIDQVSDSLKQLDSQSKKATDAQEGLTDQVTKNGGAMALLNTLTGGVAQQFKDAYEASALFTQGLKGMTLAQIRLNVAMAINPLTVAVTGVLALGAAIVEYGSSLTDGVVSRTETFMNFIKSIGNPLGFAARQAESYAKGLVAIKDAQDELQLDRSIKVLQAFGKSTIDLEIDLAQRKLQALKEGEEGYDEAYTNLLILRARRAKELQDKQLSDQEKARQEKEKELQLKRAEALRTDGVPLQEAQRTQYELYVDLAEEALNEEVELSLEANKRRIDDAKITADALQEIRMADINNIGAGFALIGQLAGRNKALQAAALIGESSVGIAKIVIATQAANAAARLKYAAIPGGLALAAAEISANKISAGIGIAANVAATAKGLAGLKEGGSPSRGVSNVDSGGVGTTAPTPPSFNVVGASGTSQLADVIAGANAKPMRAYVVASDVSTAQSLERNIVKGASL